MEKLTVSEMAEKIVREEVLCCLSVLMYELRVVAEELDDYDTYLELNRGIPDYEEAASNFILDDADFGELETIADEYGVWREVLEKVAIPDNWDETDDDNEQAWCDVEEYIEGRMTDPALVKKTIRRLVLDVVDSEHGGWEWVCEQFDLEPDEPEVYEHWAVSSWLGRLLHNAGERVEEYKGLTIWGRCTTGQSMTIDYVIEKIAKDLLGA